MDYLKNLLKIFFIVVLSYFLLEGHLSRLRAGKYSSLIVNLGKTVISNELYISTLNAEIN